MTADIDFTTGIIILACSKCRRRYPRRIAETKTGLRFKCKCKSVISWQTDLSWVACYARPYQWDRGAVSLRRAPK